MNIQETCFKCLIILLLSAQILTQKCYKKCTCLRKDLVLSNCTHIITDLNIQLNTKGIIVSCKKSISQSGEDVPSFDAMYLTSLDDNSPLTLASMAKRCSKTKAREVRYALDYNKINNITATKNMLNKNNSITYLKLAKKVDDSDEIANLTSLQTDFLTYGSHLNTLILNNLRIPILKNYFDSLSQIETLVLASNHIEVIDDRVFKSLTNLKRLNLKNNTLSRLGKRSLEGLENVIWLDMSVNELTNLGKGIFPKMKDILFLNLSMNHLKSIDTETFSSFSKLEILDLSKNSNLTLQEEDIFANLSSLKALNLSECQLRTLPTKLLYRSPLLDVLNISGNAISLLGKDAFLNLPNLRIVDLSYNNLTSLPKSLLVPLKNLQQIFLSYNKITMFNSEVFWSVHSLETIDLSNNLVSSFYNPLGRFKATNIILRSNKIDKFPRFLVNVVRLKYLDLSYNMISSVELMKEIIPKSSNIVIDVTYNQVSELKITNPEKDKMGIANGNWTIMLDISRNRLKCNCLSYQIEEVPQGQAQTAIMEITNKENICIESYPNYNCPMIYIKNCPQKCNCHYNRVYNAIVVDCSYRNLTTYPEIGGLETDRYQHNQTFVKLNGNRLNEDGQEILKSYTNVTVLDLSDNRIEELNYLPGNLTELKLDNNKLTTLPEGTVAILQNSPALRTVSFKNNPWKCDCKAVDLQKFLIANNNVKVQQSEVLCHDSREQLVYTKICEAAPNTLKIAIPVTLIALLAMASIMLALYYKNSNTIKVYLYSRNMCLWCVAEEELDKDKTYDVFISYSYKDEEFVLKELLPALESGQPSFKVCIHIRDFLPGEFINTQIVNSVMNSRRTLVVLSNNFMESVWGKMEFRTAHTQAISEGRARVIMVLYGELDENVLDEEMKAYLKTNTYVKWGDPWFWSKLRYALPHSKFLRRHLSHQSEESFHLS